MASTTAHQTLLSPAELAYLRASLSLTPPIRPDGRSPTQFRPLTAETGILPGTNGSARVCFSDGTEAIVGVKTELEKTAASLQQGDADSDESKIQGEGNDENDAAAGGRDDDRQVGRNEWLELTVEIPGLKDDDGSTVFLASMLSEALLADGEFARKLYINRRFHWKLYLDILLISPPLSYPLPLLSLTTHLALLATRVPYLKSEGDEDPMFDDDWQASTYLYPRDDGSRQSNAPSSSHGSRPPITLLVVSVGGNIIFDPAKEELAVAESCLAVSIAEMPKSSSSSNSSKGKLQTMTEKGKGNGDDGPAARELRLLSVRTIDPPSRQTPPGVPNADNPGTSVAGTSGTATTPGKKASGGQQQQQQQGDAAKGAGIWRPPLGGTKFAVLESMIAKVLEKGGVADEVLDGLDGVDLG